MEFILGWVVGLAAGLVVGWVWGRTSLPMPRPEYTVKFKVGPVREQ